MTSSHNMRRGLLLLLSTGIGLLTLAQNGTEYRVWFDDDEANAMHFSSDSAHLSATIDITSLPVGLHTIFCQAQDSTGWSGAKSDFFMILEHSACNLCYWFDNSDDRHPLNSGSTVQQIDISQLADGMHTLSCQAVTSEGTMSGATTSIFLKVPDRTKDSTYVCSLWVDGKLKRQDTVPHYQQAIQYDIDVSDLTPGLHHVSAEIMTRLGFLSIPTQTYFYRTFTTAETSGMRCFYAIDEQPFEMAAQQIDSSTFCFQIDISQCSTGLHKLSVEVTDGDMLNTESHSVYFCHKSDKDNGIALIDYRINDEQVRDTVEIETQANPFDRNVSLDIDTMPFCSKRFHFEIADSLPMVYSQNDIHTTFTNFHGLTADTSARYTEYRVSRPVTATGYLRGFSGEVSACINDNQIVWYFLPCTAGDSVSLRTSQDADLHTFSPSGKETIFRTGQQATSYSSFTAEETGYYYIGIHDVTGASKTTALHYLRGVPPENHFQLTYMVDSQVYMTDSIAYGIHPDTVCAPSKEGYTFCKWNDLPDLMPAHDVSVEGYFTVNSYILTYLVDGMPYGCDTILFSTAPVPLPEPEKEGYTFGGWSGIPATMPAQDVTITGSFSINSYILTYFVDEDFLTTEQYCYGDTIHLIETLQREGCTFSGWILEQTNMPAHDISVKGYFIPNRYLLTYLVDQVFFLNDSISFGSAISPMEYPILEGHYFSGWDGLPDVMPAHNVTANGRFMVNSYDLTYLIDGEIYSAQSVAYRDSIAPMSPPSKAGCTFSGWQGEPVIMPAHDVTVSGTFITGETSVNLPEAPFDVYNLQGLLILRHASEKDLMALPSGLYIANGHVIYVKHL